MKTKDRSMLGKTYRGPYAGNDIRTGLSRLSGGRRSGNLVCWRTVNLTKLAGRLVEGIQHLTMTAPIATDFESIDI